MTDDTQDTLDIQHPDELTSLKATAAKIGLTYHPSIGVDKLRLKVQNALSETPVPESELGLENDEEDEDSDELTPEEEAAEQEAPVVSSIPKPTEMLAVAPAPVEPVATPAPVDPAVIAALTTAIKEELALNTPTRDLTPQEKVNAARDEARKEATKLIRVNVQCMNPLKKEWPGEIITVGNGLIGTISKMVPFDTVDGWHIPNIIYLYMKERQYQQFAAKKVPKGQPSSRVTKLVREFAIEVLPDLTEKELAALKQRQLIAKNSQE